MLLKMMDLCARSEQSSGEIRQKLYRKGITGHEARKIIDRLIDDIAAGRKFMKVYRQMKMYNDPSTNPVLYAGK